MKRGEGFIDWGTAKIAVTDDPQSHTLTVDVVGDLGSHWRVAFQNMMQIHNQDQARRPRAWGNVSLNGTGSTMGGTEIQVDDVKPGAEDDLKAQLDQLAKLASQNAVPKAENDERLRAEKHTRAQERANQATEMEERFRAA